jgi:hypothetical protein
VSTEEKAKAGEEKGVTETKGTSEEDAAKAKKKQEEEKKKKPGKSG